MKFSVIIPTLNEEQRLAHTLRCAVIDDAEYIVADGGSTDNTRGIAEAFGARVITGAQGRGLQLEQGFRAARGEVCIFLHADTVLPPDAAAAICDALRDERVVGGAFSLRFAENTHALLARAINARSRITGTATGDQAMFARRAVLEKIGGVPRVPLFEDIRLCSALRRVGRFVVLRESVATSARLWQRKGASRIVVLHWALRALHAAGVPPRALVRLYPSAR